MDKPMPLAVAAAQLEQAQRDFLAAYEHAIAADHVSDKLAASTALLSLRSLEKSGWTDGGRKSLRTAIESVKSILGVA